MKKIVPFLSLMLAAVLVAGCSSGPVPVLTISTPNNASALAWPTPGQYIFVNGSAEISLTTSKAGAIGLWDVTTGELHQSLISASDTNDYSLIGQIDVNPESTLMLVVKPYVAGTTKGFVNLYNIPDNKLLSSWEGLYLDGDATKAGETIQGAAFSPDGTKFAILGSLYVRIFESDSYRLLDTFPTNAHGGEFSTGDERLYAAMAWSPDGKKIAWTILGNLSVYDLASKAVIVLKDSSTGSIPAPNKGLDWSPDGSTLVYEKDKALVFVDAASGEKRSSLTISGNFEENHVLSVAYSPDGTMVAFCALEVVGVWNLADNQSILSLAIAKPVDEQDRYNAVAWSPDSTRLAVLHFGNKQVLIYNIVK